MWYENLHVIVSKTVAELEVAEIYVLSYIKKWLKIKLIKLNYKLS